MSATLHQHTAAPPMPPVSSIMASSGLRHAAEQGTHYPAQNGCITAAHHDISSLHNMRAQPSASLQALDGAPYHSTATCMPGMGAWGGNPLHDSCTYSSKPSWVRCPSFPAPPTTHNLHVDV
mmetsp:Transcript_15824/g.34137  ORF Transcript_15824/g.34137 Transcript_15824/m.34137 type:complete len:122 (-) Transcript_15824:971-1336(-)